MPLSPGEAQQQAELTSRINAAVFQIRFGAQLGFPGLIDPYAEDLSQVLLQALALGIPGVPATVTAAFTSVFATKAPVSPVPYSFVFGPHNPSLDGWGPANLTQAGLTAIVNGLNGAGSVSALTTLAATARAAYLANNTVWAALVLPTFLSVFDPLNN